VDEDDFRDLWNGAIESGVNNAEVLRLAKAWCQHARLDRRHLGTGMIEVQTGLPVSGGRLTCDYARKPVNAESMNLEPLALEFYENNCIGCPNRLPGGEEPNLGTLADEAIKERDERATVAREQARLAEEARRQRAADRRMRLREAGERSRHVLDLVERVDTEDDQVAARDLVHLARLEPEAFTDPVLDDLVATAIGNVNDSLMESVFALHAARGTPDTQLVQLAFDAVAAGVAVSPAAAVIARSADSVDPRPIVLRNLIELAAGSADGPGPEFEAEPEALVRLFDVASASVIEALGELVRSDDPWARGSGARAVRRLFLVRPTAIEPLLPAVLEGLMLPDRSRYYGEPHPASEAAYAVAVALHSDPDTAEQLIEPVWSASDDSKRRRLLRCYRNTVGRFSDRSAATSLLARIATRALSVASSSDRELPGEGLDLLEEIAEGNREIPGLELASIAEAMVSIATENERLAGEAVPTEILAALEWQNLLLSRRSLLSKAADALGCVGAHQPIEFSTAVEELWERYAGREVLRVALLRGVGRAMRHAESVGFAIPLLSRALGSGTRSERRAALYALHEGSRYGRTTLPADVAAQVIDSLREADTAIAAVRVLNNVDVPEDRLVAVLNALLTIAVNLAPHRDDVAQEALWAALRLARGTGYEEQVTDYGFDAVEKMPSTEAAETLRAFPETHSRWPAAAIKSLHLDKDPQYWSLGDRDREEVLERLMTLDPSSLRPYLDELVTVGVERLPDDRAWAWRVAESLASAGEHVPAAAIAEAVAASIPDTIEQRRPRAYAEKIAIGHRLNAALAARDHVAASTLRGRLDALGQDD